MRTTCVRVNGTLHDFMMLNPLRETAAATAAIEQAVHVLRTALTTAEPIPSTESSIPCHRTSPAIVLVHGAFAESASWDPVIDRLHRHRAVVVAGNHGGDRRVVAVANPLRDLGGDAAYVRDVIAAVGAPVLVVAHSYGGMVMTEAAAGNDAVVGLVYVHRSRRTTVNRRSTCRPSSPGAPWPAPSTRTPSAPVATSS